MFGSPPTSADERMPSEVADGTERDFSALFAIVAFL